MLFLENISLALTAIKTNKMRSFLTMLGIIIGISSVIAISSIGASAKGAVTKEFESIGASYMYLMPNWQMQEDGFMETDMFNLDDVDALKARFPNDIHYAAPYATDQCSTKVGRTEADLSLYGVGDRYNEYDKRIKLLHGRMINENDIKASKPNIVVDVKLAQRLFGKDDVTGELMPITVAGESKDANIVGVYELEKSMMSGLDSGSRFTCYMAYSAVQPSWSDYFHYIEIYANPDKSVSEQGDMFARYMEKIKDKDPNFYMYESAESQLSMINTVLGVLSIAIGAIAAISLLVGGIGIMNIMLVSVTERTREIGIRKSLGARTKDILTQFLIEAMILSIIGGILGTALGVGIGGIGMAIANAFGVSMSLVIEPSTVVVAVIFSAGVGLFFGLFPARKAAKLDPIEALRFE